MAAFFGFCQQAVSQPFEELRCLNFEFMLITPKSIFGTHFGTMVAIFDFFKRISQLFEELLSWDLKIELITLESYY